MSFVTKGKRKNKTKHNPNKKLNKIENLEVTSESEQDSEDNEESSDEEETAQEKRLRLAKIYLDEIKKQEKERLEDKDTDAEVSNRLKEDYLKQTGKFRNTLADQYTGIDSNNLNILRCKEHKKSVTCICISFDDKYIFSGSKDGSVVKWLLKERKKLASISLTTTITCIAVSDDFKFLAVSSKSNQIEILNPTNLTHIHSLRNHKNSVTGVVFRKNSHDLYSCSKDKSVKVWNLTEMSYLETLFGHQDSIMAIDALSTERAVTAGLDSSLRLWKIPEESQLIFSAKGSTDCVKLINEDFFISGGDSGDLCVWNLTKQKPVCLVESPHGFDEKNQQPLWITSVASLVNTDLVASGSSDGVIRLWKVSNDCKSISPLFTIPAVGFVNSLQFTADGKSLIAGIGREHWCGRWTVIEEAKNGVMIIPLVKSN